MSPKCLMTLLSFQLQLGIPLTSDLTATEQTLLTIISMAIPILTIDQQAKSRSGITAPGTGTQLLRPLLTTRPSHPRCTTLMLPHGTLYTCSRMVMVCAHPMTTVTSTLTRMILPMARFTNGTMHTMPGTPHLTPTITLTPPLGTRRHLEVMAQVTPPTIILTETLTATTLTMERLSNGTTELKHGT